MSATRQQRGPAFLDDYVSVHTRIERFYEKYPEGRIVTQLIETAGEGLVCFKAMIYRAADSADPDATGHAIDRLDLKDSTFEKTETASVGRALANLGFEVKQGIASREEVEKAQRHGGELSMRKVEGAKPAPVAESAFSENGEWKAGDQARDAILAAENAATSRTGIQRKDLRDWIEKRHRTRALWTLEREVLLDYQEYLKGLR